MAESSLEDVDLVLKTMAQTIVDNAVYFAQLDSVVGDGDFGYSLRNGFEVVLSDWDNLDRTNPGTLLKKVGLIIASKVGGVSGPIWGTGFLRAGSTAGDKAELTGEDVVAMLRAAIAGIMARGGAALGDKTLLDALAPATDSLEKSLADPATASDHGVAAVQLMADVATEGSRRHQADARPAWSRGLHGRAKYRFGRCGSHGNRRDLAGGQRLVERQVRQVEKYDIEE
jgi:dihydroxyacetone kinase-like protein